MPSVHWCWDNQDNKLSEEACRQRVRLEITVPVTGKDHAGAGNLTYDPKSIMHYDIWRGWLKNHPEPIPAATDLSPNDLDCVSKLYGSTERPVPTPQKQTQQVPELAQETCSVSSERHANEEGITCVGKCTYPHLDFPQVKRWHCGGYVEEYCNLNCRDRKPVLGCLPGPAASTHIPLAPQFGGLGRIGLGHILIGRIYVGQIGHRYRIGQIAIAKCFGKARRCIAAHDDFHRLNSHAVM
jgi:hypothetical protein